jgi:16S rRNA (guanine527-N7)-methyltransferase
MESDGSRQVSVLRAAGAAVSEEAGAALGRWCDLLLRWNRRVNLTSVTDPAAVAEVHLVDSSLAAIGLGEGERLVDVGSGAGLPGLVVAVLRPDVAVTLVEPTAKKVAFLRAAVEATGCRNVEVVRGRDVDLPGAAWDRAVSRATMEPAEWLRSGARLVPPGGRVGAMVAAEGKLPTAPSGLALVERHAVVLPTSRAARTIGWYRREP